MSAAEEDATAGGGSGGGSSGSGGGGAGSSGNARRRFDDKGLVARTSLILWHTHQNDVNAVRKLLEEDAALVNARDYDSRTPLHVAALHGWHDVAECLIANGADVNAQDRWQNTVSGRDRGDHVLSVTLCESGSSFACWKWNASSLVGVGGLDSGLAAGWTLPPVLKWFGMRCSWLLLEIGYGFFCGELTIRRNTITYEL
jgi:hypothetical protein